MNRLPELASADDLARQIRAVRDEADLLGPGLAPGGDGSSQFWSAANPPPGLLPADFVPGYCFLREVHRGGQGVVYEATQLSTRRRVAIKIVRPTTTNRSAAQVRFEREAELLTQLRHPNIVTVHDAGVAADAFFIVMDFVDGVPLDEFVRQRQAAHVARDVSSQARSRTRKTEFETTLRLFAGICDAVNAAHLRGIIHRDLKPANILVDHAGEPRVLDFGLAKLVADPGQAGSSDAETLTSAGGFLGSLPWASPEQAAGDHTRIDIRTDVYSLGVTFYQLLTGRFPYDVTGPMRDVLNHIVQSEPARPRAGLRRLSPSLDPSIPRSLDLFPIDSDLESIVLKCLSKDPGRRYQSAGDLAADLRRYLAGEAIDAKRDSRWYLLRKALRRNRVPVAVAAAFVLLVTCGTVVSTVLWQRAEEKAMQAETIASVMEATLDGVDPFRRGGLDTQLLKKMMDEAAQHIRDGDLTVVPEVELRLRVSIGRVYRRIAEFNAAHDMLDPAVDLARTHYPAESRQMVDALTEAAQVLAHEGRSLEALERFQALKELLQRIDHGVSKRLAEVQEMIVDRLRALGRNEEALAAAHEGIEMHRHLSPPDEEGALDHQLNLALVLLELDRQSEALPRFEKILPDLRKRGDHPYVAWALDGLGTCLMEIGEHEKAVSAFQEATDIMRQFHGRPHQQQVRPRLVEALRRSKRFEEAVQCGREYVRLFAAHPDWDDVARRQTEWFLARALDDAGRTAEAIESLREYVAYARSQSRAATRSTSLLKLAWMLLKAGPIHAVEVESLTHESLNMMAEVELEIPSLAWLRFHAMSLLGEALVLQSRFSDAERLLLDGYGGLTDAAGVPATVTYDQDFKGDAVRRIVRFYESWDAAEPNQRHDAQAAEWRARQERR